MRRGVGNILGEGPAGEDIPVCSACDRAFLTVPGRQQDLRHAHPDYLNATRLAATELNEESQRGLSEYHKILMAKAEAEAVVEGVLPRGINKVL